MDNSAAQHDDPLSWTLLLTAGFAVLVTIRLTIPAAPYFDETHYVPAARAMLALEPANPEHPLLAKQLIAAGLALFGDGPLGWRIMPAVFGALAFFAICRAMWFTTLSRPATLFAGVLVATGFPLLVHARIAMLDIFYVAFLMLAFWQIAAAVRGAGAARVRLAIAGAALGCAMASKWTALALAALPGLAFMIIRLEAAGPRFLTDRTARPIPGVSLIEAGIWLAVVPLGVYLVSFWPAFLYERDALSLARLIPFQWDILALQQQVVQPHTYQSTWAQWVLNTRAIWYLYEPVEGVQRGILLIGHPLTSLLGLAAFAWAAFVGVFRKRWDALALALLYAASLGFWVVAAKPIQFYYHYLIPHIALMGCLALALAELWQAGKRNWVYATIAVTLAIFVFYYPILTAGALSDPMDFQKWAWIEGWK